MFCLSSLVGSNGGVDLCLHALDDWHVSEEANGDCHHHSEDSHEHTNHSDESEGVSLESEDCRECVHLKIVSIDAACILSQNSIDVPDLIPFESVLPIWDVESNRLPESLSIPPLASAVPQSVSLLVRSTVFLV